MAIYLQKSDSNSNGLCHTDLCNFKRKKDYFQNVPELHVTNRQQTRGCFSGCLWLNETTGLATFTLQ